MSFKVGDLVRVIDAADQSLWIRNHVGMIGIIVETISNQDYFHVRYKVLVEEHFAVFHPLDLERLKNEDR
jgi:hypothetical protein